MKNMSNQMKAVVGLVVALLLLFFAGMNKEEEQEVVEQPPIQQEEQVEEPKIEEPKEEIEEPIEDELGLNIEQQTQMAIDYLDIMAEESFGVGGYKIVSEEGKIILYGDINTSEIANCSEADYSMLVDTLLETSESVSNAIYDLGCTDVMVGVGVADVSEDVVFLLAEDGRLLFDIFNQ